MAFFAQFTDNLYKLLSPMLVEFLPLAFVSLCILVFLTSLNAKRDLEFAELKRKLWCNEVTNHSLARLNQELKDTIKHRSNVLSIMSHELRTPLSGITGLADLLMQSNLNQMQVSVAQSIRTCTVSLSAVIDEILNFSHLDLGKEEVQFTQVNIVETIENIVELTAPLAQAKGLDIAHLIRSEVPITIDTDPIRLRQILINLVGNAVKFTQTGGVGIEVYKDNDELQFKVQDTGQGVKETIRKKLFLPFETSNRNTGTGLGLAISHMSAVEIGAELSLSQTNQYGSTFNLKIPLAEIKIDSYKDPIYSSNEAIIFAVGPFFPTYLAAYLAQFKILSDVNPQDLVENSIEFVFIDHALGEEKARALALQARSLDAKHIVLLTSPFAHQSIHDQIGTYFDAWLIKPIRQSSLARLIDGTLQTPVRRPSDMHPVIEPTLSGKALLIEDNEINRLVISHQLRSLGFEVNHASDGASALEHLEMCRREQQFPDFIITDFYLSDRTGAEIAKVILEEMNLKIPIYALSAALQINQEDMIYFNAVLKKPLDLGQFRQLIAKNIPNRAAA